VRHDLDALEERQMAAVARFGWIARRVPVLIEEEFGVHYNSGPVRRIPRSLGRSPQRPVGRPIEPDKKAIAEWRRTTWHDLEEKPAKKGARSFSSTKGD
jgi:transposase